MKKTSSMKEAMMEFWGVELGSLADFGTILGAYGAMHRMNHADTSPRLTDIECIERQR